MAEKMNFSILALVVMSVLFLFGCSEMENGDDENVTKTVITAGGSVSGSPYSPGILVGNTLYCSGRLGTDPETNELGAGIREQTRLSLESIKKIVGEAGLTMSDVVNVNVFLKNVDDFTDMNEVYGTFFPADPPARTTVAVGALVKDALIEISCIAVKTGK